MRDFARLHGLQGLEHDLRALQPLAVGIGGAELLLDLVVRDDAALLEVDEQHLARLQAPLLDDRLLRDRQHAHLGGKHDEAVVGDEIARRPEAVAVEGGADLAAVREADGGGAVPGLHERGVILVEGAPALVHERVAGPGLRDQHHHGVRERVAAAHQELERVVEAGGVRLALVGDRPQLGDVVAEQAALRRSLPRRHPVDVAAQGVDLAVMGDHPVGMGELPSRERVGGEALVHEREGALEARVLQVAVVAADLRDQHHALVDDGPGRQADRVVALGARILAVVDGVRDDLAGHEQAPLESLLVGDAFGPPDEDLPVQGLGRLDGFAEVAVVDRHVAPAEQDQALVGDRPLDRFAHQRETVRIARHEQMADSVMSRLRKGETERGAFLLQEAMRDLHEDAAAVAHLGIGADGAAVVEVPQDVEALRDDGVRFAVLHIDDEADPAGILLVVRIVEALPLRKAGVAHGEPAVRGLRRGGTLLLRSVETVRGGTLAVALLHLGLLTSGLVHPWLTHGHSSRRKDVANSPSGSGMPGHAVAGRPPLLLGGLGRSARPHLAGVCGLVQPACARPARSSRATGLRSRLALTSATAYPNSASTKRWDSITVLIPPTLPEFRQWHKGRLTRKLKFVRHGEHSFETL